MSQLNLCLRTFADMKKLLPDKGTSTVKNECFVNR
jgi:hypothetical protein